MKIKRKITILFIVSLIIMIVVLYLFRETQQNQQKLINNTVLEQQLALVNSAIKTRTEQLNQIAMDYSNWDELISNMETPDQSWAEDNIASVIESFNLYSASVYNKRSQLVYHFGRQKAGNLDCLSDKESIITETKRTKFVHFFVLLPEGLCEMAGVTIHTSKDSTKKALPSGYFFINRMWNQQFLSELSRNTVSSIRFSTEKPLYSENIANDSITVTKAIKNLNHDTIGYLITKKPNNTLINFHEISELAVNFLGVFILFLLIIFFVVLYRWIRQPLKIISDSLQNNDTSKLKIIEKNKDEFSQIAHLISIFHQQKEVLEKENIKIIEMQTQLIRQRNVLHSLAISSNQMLTNENLEQAIHESLKEISDAADVDRIFIYKNIPTTEDAPKKIEQVVDYISPRINEKINNLECKNLEYSNNNEGWHELLKAGKTIKGHAADFKEHIQELFNRQCIQSIIVVPILEENKSNFWGFVGMASCTKMHPWSIAEETALNLLASNIGGAIKREHSQDELKKAMELAKSADKAKSEFLASMSHEIRTPMNGVIGMTSLLLLSELTPTQREYVNIIETSGESLMNIINEILDFSKIESGKMELEETSFDLGLCIEDVLDLMAPKALEKHLDIIYYIDPDVHQQIFGDGFRLRQILVNLVSNAIKFTDQGDILITVSSEKNQKDQVVLNFSVKDTGIGIPSKKVESLFAPFTQVDASTTRKYGGTGLGLAITSSLVKMMNGQIWVTSEEHIGSTFQFTIQTKNSYSSKQNGKNKASLQSLEGKSVLIVDDNATNRRILSLQCEYWGLKATAVETGKEALKILNDQIFDVAILDMQMPEMDGITLATEIRKKLDKGQLPLIMLTSVGFNKDAEELKTLFSHYVNKPIKHSQLADILFYTTTSTHSKTRSANTEKEKLGEISKEFPFQILVAEDNLINQKLIRNVFELLGYKITLAANGLEALDALKRKYFDLIFMDIQMPEMNGYEASKIIVQHRKNMFPIIIAMTANAMQGDREKCMEAGMDDYITKPMKVGDLVKVIQLWGKKYFPAKS